MRSNISYIENQNHKENNKTNVNNVLILDIYLFMMGNRISAHNPPCSRLCNLNVPP